ncbi:MAG: MFS transporter, partial [Proteobacteria bacterium]|nr:MFS transporter [Pseudomonadota bacterium]
AAEALQASPSVILGAFSWSLLVSGACAPRVGKWIDHHGGRGALLVSIVVMAAGQAALALAPNIAVWFLGWTIIGLGMSMGLYDAAFATVGGLLRQEAGPTITGITLIAGFASTVFWTFGAALLLPLGWRGLLAVYVGIMLLVNLPMVWLLIPPAPPRPPPSKPAPGTASGRRARRGAAICLGAFFALRWFITSAIAVHVISLMSGIGLGAAQAVAVAALIGPGQVAGRMLDWTIGMRVGLLVRARVAALLLPLGAALLLTTPWIGPLPAAMAFTLLYGMSNGIMTINRGTLPLALFGADGYARILGWLALPVQLAQAVAPTVSTPLVTALPPLDVLLLAGGAGGLAVLLLLPLRLPR